MRAGKLRDLVVFKRTVSVSDGAGGSQIAWKEFYRSFGELRMSKGKEVVDAGRIGASAAGTLVIRYSSSAAAVTASDIVEIGGVTYNIRSPALDPDRRRERLELVVERGVAV
ncbi:Phage head-tail joining protein [Pseudovibrio sp. Ad5]|uniref:phage head closure protein n=1 Tax=Pseudovibrio sp. Ad5 TaxID=989436 RepID=UPI0007AE88E0|nr:phage head closure protein [Pseudovibrio sp. Ad5]KZK96335.1 Phage head-tail joining protein [Pseudovibrio sp. Ad5]